MERKIGEIFKLDGEWYQCIESDSCGECSLFTTECGSGTKSDLADKVAGLCSKVRRIDSKHAVFKKLEKIGEPYSCNYYGDNRLIMMQEYNLYNLDDVTNEDKTPMYITDYKHKRIAIEIKQTKENMEEKNNVKHSNSEKIGKNLKEFDLEAAKLGKPVCTRDGRKARIICFDKEGNFPLVVLVKDEANHLEEIKSYSIQGVTDVFRKRHPRESEDDLMMLSEKREGWINVYALNTCYPSKEEAEANIDKDYEDEYLRTVKIEWEE